MTAKLNNESNVATAVATASAGAGKAENPVGEPRLLEYEKPVLISFGDVRDITLGPTLGTAESGCAGVFRPGSGLPPGTTCPPGGN